MDKRSKVWAAAIEGSANFQIESIEICRSNIFEKQLIEIPRIAAIVGYHGAGKTMFLRLLESVLGSVREELTPPFIKAGYAGSVKAKQRVEAEVEVVANFRGRSANLRLDLARPYRDIAESWANLLGEHVFGEYLSAPHMAQQIGYLYGSRGFDGEDLSEAELLRHYRSQRLSAIRNILGRDYRKFSVFRIPEYLGNETVVHDPYFVGDERVGSERAIDSSMMSTGEIWVHWLLGWEMDNLRDLSAVCLIDEPESFLSPRGHRALLDEIVRTAVSTETQFLIATHSRRMIEMFPLSCIRLCTNSAGKILVHPPRNSDQIRRSLGDRTDFSGLVLVEDKFAAQVLNLIVEHIDHSLIGRIEILATNGVHNVLGGVRSLVTSERIVLFGVLDGDCRDTEIRLPPEARKRISFLPGTHAPEYELLRVANEHVHAVAVDLSVRIGDVYEAIAQCSDRDHQYFLPIFSGSVGKSESLVLQSLVAHWLKEVDSYREAGSVIDMIKNSGQ
ncbi:hypothetical protein [Mycobacteroides franklinii]|uniref:hypothetical protein n=1 Tax=Mycobacteroides franklinii TaxID=948102 RepID=UPI0012FFC40A|nr:hypothetical protein [Mycobacteroides franklinii]